MVSQNFINDELGTPKKPSAAKKLVDLLFLPSSFIRLANEKRRETNFPRKDNKAFTKLDYVLCYGTPTIWEAARLYGYYKLCEGIANYL